MPTIPNVGALGAPTGATRTPKSSLGKDDFLTLLTAQLRHQDPTGSNSDPSQFVAQMTQFTMLEQITNLVKANEELAASTRRDAAVGLVGRTVTWKGGSGVVESVSVTDGKPTLTVGGRAGIDPATLTEVR
jgi:flagellar basal-body rod modification protein FlgD